MKKVLDPLVSQAVAKEIPSSVLNTDYSYTISNAPNSATYSNINLSNVNISNSVNIYVQINAITTSSTVLGSSNYIGVAVYAQKTDISNINSISIPSSVKAADLSAVTKTELSTAISSQVLTAVQNVEPYATESDYTINILNWDGKAYTPVNLLKGYAFVLVTITENSNSLILSGVSKQITVIFPPQTN